MSKAHYEHVGNCITVKCLLRQTLIIITITETHEMQLISHLFGLVQSCTLVLKLKILLSTFVSELISLCLTDSKAVVFMKLGPDDFNWFAVTLLTFPGYRSSLSNADLLSMSITLRLKITVSLWSQTLAWLTAMICDLHMDDTKAVCSVTSDSI